MTIESGELVVRRIGPKGEVGVVTGSDRGVYYVRWRGSKKAERVAAFAIKAAKACALLLEGSLDADLTSTRSEARILRDWLHSWDVRLAYKNVHCLHDLKVWRRALAKTPFLFVHFNCHGTAVQDERGPYIRLMPGKRTYLLADDTIAVLRDLFEGLDVLFSACELGKYEQHMRRLKKQAGLATVAAYSREVDDDEATVFDLCLYHGMLLNGWKFETAVNNAVEAVKQIGVVGTPGRDQRLVRLF